MVLLRVIKQNGQKYVETQTGELLPITGEHLAKDATAVAIYRDNGNNYWFIDKQGQPMAIPPEKVQWAINSIEQQRAAKQAAAMTPNPYGQAPQGYPTGTAPVQQTTIVNPSSSGGSSGMGAVGTGLAAAGGAMAGSMIGAAINDNNHYYGMPYGAPMYRGEGNHPYYNDPNGNKVYVNNAHNNNVTNQWNKQGNWDNRNQWANQQPKPTPQGDNLASAQQNENGRKRFRDRGNKEGQGGAAGRSSGDRDGWGGFSGGNLQDRQGGGRREGGGRRFGRR
jgi:hypothetical protein